MADTLVNNFLFSLLYYLAEAFGLDNRKLHEKSINIVRPKPACHINQQFQVLTNNDDEQRCIAQVKQGSQNAFHSLYQQHHKRIYALCWRMLADKESAEDVCQEVFVVLWQKINQFHGNLALGYIVLPLMSFWATYVNIKIGCSEFLA